MGWCKPSFWTVFLLVYGFLAMNCFMAHAQLLPETEVQALKSISSKMNITDWKDISRTSCNESSSMNKTYAESILSNVKCDCSFINGSVCHITNIQLKGLNLTGEIPAEFRNLTHLTEIDLTRNYLNGSIPTSISQLPLVILSLLANRLSGPIPKEIGDIATLEELVLEDNLLGGSLHPNLGKLSNLRRMLFSANNFTGTIPETFGNLKNLTDFRIDGNSFSGKIPEFIGNWTKLKRLDMQGSSLEGPIPSTISLLQNLTDLRITDLKGSNSTIPDLKAMTEISILVLRNCLIRGPIPDYLGELTLLKTLDLSFNRLTGRIPAAVRSLEELRFLFLNNNRLTGAVPDWILNNRNVMDLSYNDFTESPPASCQQSDVNLVSSFASSGKNTVAWCLRKDLPCPRKAQHHTLFINCGGSKMDYEGNSYEEDLNRKGPSTFSSSAEKWAYSSTGVFTGNDRADFIVSNSLLPNVMGTVYETARVSPQSLKYYGLCLLQGSYTVKLHFAEIMYTDDQTFSSLGRRIFDVSIQGKVVLEDFNIAERAKGIGKNVTMVFNNVTVEGSTLEIDLYWPGKGTTAVPDRGVYGPLISAISITPNFKVDTGGGLSAGVIAGIVVSSIVVVILLLVVLWMLGYLGGKDDENSELRGLDLQTGFFTLKQIKAATGNFSPANKIGEGGFGPVYKGILADGGIIAVKQLSSKSKQGNREFVNEIGMISALQHPHLVKLYGCCIEGNQLLLIYEYLENNSLARALFGHEDKKIKLDWSTRKRICLQIAKGLAYLHEESRLKIVHRDIKATNVLLDKDLNAKISDFGLAKLDEEENTHISTRIAGTIGYMAPEYAMRGYLTDKADVYSFGIVALEIVSGKSNTNYRPKEEFVYLLDWAYVLEEQGNLLELVDPDLGKHYSKEGAMKMLNVALLCTNPSPTLRPSMTSVVSMLEGKIPVQAPKIKRNTFDEEMRFKAFERLSHDSQTFVSNSSQESHEVQSMSIEAPWPDTSTSQTKSSNKLLPDV